MAPFTPQELNSRREEHCFAVTPEKKYFHAGNTFIKRSLRPSEWVKFQGYMHVPLFCPERVLNEGACIQYLADKTDIPLPKLHACFEDDGAAYLILEYVEGIGMDTLSDEDKDVVTRELEGHIRTLQSLTSDTWGGPGGVVIPPYRIMKNSNGRPWRMARRSQPDLVFSHNDLSASNVIVDPDTLKINAIIDWEYAGFYPPGFDRPFYKRRRSTVGPSVALDGEVDDVEALTDIIDKERENTRP